MNGLSESSEVVLAEVAMIEKVGVKVESGKELEKDFTMADLQANLDAAVLSGGLGARPGLGMPGEELIIDGMNYIERSKLDAPNLVIGHNVVVIGAGNTAIDCATIAKRLGASQVTMVYRRTEKEITAYAHEYDFINSEGGRFFFCAQPVRVNSKNGTVKSLACL